MPNGTTGVRNATTETLRRRSHARRTSLVLVVLVVLGLVAAGCIPSGNHEVSSFGAGGVSPGLWRSVGSPDPAHDCTWSRTSGGGATGSGSVAYGQGPIWVEILPSDRRFEQRSCMTFWGDPGPWARPLVTPGQPFGPGWWKVGYEVAPGTYTAPGGEACQWARLANFRGEHDVIESSVGAPGPQAVTIAGGDVGFRSQHCGTWTRAALPPAPTGATASPVTPYGVPDPFVMVVQDSTFCGSTAPCYAAYSTQVYLTTVPVFRSTDLTSWQFVGDALPGVGETNATWVQWGANWAPGVYHRADGTYVMYYTARSKALGVQCIGRATSTHPQGPFSDPSSGPFLCQSGGTIDASPFLDPTTGRLYLLYKSDATVGIYSRELSTTGTSFVGSEIHLLSPGVYSWENPIEAPSMMRDGAGQLFLFYSAGEYWEPTYRVGVARCSSPSGPCSRVYSTALLASQPPMYGPGGQTPIKDLSGAWRMAFHAWSSSADIGIGDLRKLHFLPLTFPHGNPKIG